MKRFLRVARVFILSALLFGISGSPAQAALQYVGGTSGSGTGATYAVSLTSLSGGIGSSPQAGDIVIVVTGWASTSNDNPGVTTTGYAEEPSGTDLYSNDTRDANVSANWKIMGATPDTSVTASGFNNAANGGGTVVQVWRGADQTTPMDATVTTASANNQSASSFDSPSITPVTSGAYVLSAGLGTDDTTPLTKTAPTGYSNEVVVTGTGTTMSATVGIASKAWSSGAENPGAWSGGETSTSDSWGAFSIALRPASAPTVTTQSASPVGTTTATLNGNITATGNAYGGVTVRGFAWGTLSTLSGGDTATTTENGSFSTGAFTGSLTTLVCNTAYYSRAYAVNGIGTSTGAISASFTTNACPSTVTTQSATSVSTTTATFNGNITATGGANASVRGFAWGTSATMNGDTATTTETGSFGTGAFTNSSQTLVCNTTYYTRAYATNPAGDSFGAISASFTTNACAPTVTTQSATSVSTTTATFNGNITATGGANASVRGFAWGTSATMNGDTATTTENGSFGTGAFTNSSQVLTCNTTYYTRAYATNPGGNSFGAISASFTTNACAPTVTTQSATSVSTTTATFNGNITATGGGNASVRGFAWGTSATMNGDTATTTETGSFGTGAFTNSSQTLVCNTTYYTRAYATNPGGTSLGAISASFTTNACAATVTTSSATSVTDTAATLNGNITATGGANASVRGFAWGTLSTLSGGDTATTTESGSFGTGAFTGSLTTLTCNTTYYSRAYATNPGGDSFGAISASFTTTACLPTVTTQSASSVGATSATLNGNITATGGANPSKRGFAWGTSATMVGDTATTTENGSFSTGAFTDSAQTFVGNTTYYSRAYAVNTAGTSTGAISASFLTLPNTPGTPSASSITATTLTVNWTAPTGGATSYKIERCTGSACSSYVEIAAGVTDLFLSQTGLSAATTYRYRVRATNGTGDGAYATSADITTSATASVELSAWGFFATSTSYTPGAALASQNTAATLVTAGDDFRMRILLHGGVSNIAVSERAFKLQFAAKSGSCDNSFTGESYADVTTLTTISYKDTAGLTDNTALGAQSDLTHSADTIINQTYEELNNFSNTQAVISSGQDGKWDFSLYDNGGTPGQAYCLRVVNSDGSLINTYPAALPEIAIPASNPALSQIHYRWRNDDGGETAASFIAAEDTDVTSDVYPGDRRRVRFQLNNTGGGAATNYTYLLEQASTTCSSGWIAVPNTNSGGTHWLMDSSPYITDATATTHSSGLSNPGGTFAAGAVKTTGNQTNAHSLPANQYSEFEYSIRSTSIVTVGTSYCFRLTNAGSTANFTYTKTPKMTISASRPAAGGGGNIGSGGETGGSGVTQTGGGQGGTGAGTGGSSNTGAGGETGGSGTTQTGGGQTGGGGDSG